MLRKPTMSELMDEATLSLLLSADVTIFINHNTLNYIVIKEINGVCELKHFGG